jgi:hypothetical protein
MSPHRLTVLTDLLWLFSTPGKCWKLSEIWPRPLSCTLFPVSLFFSPKVWVHSLLDYVCNQCFTIIIPVHDTVFFPA